MPLLQKWLSWLVGLGAGYLVVTHPEGVFKAGQALRSVTAGSITDVVSGKSKA